MGKHPALTILDFPSPQYHHISQRPLYSTRSYLTRDTVYINDVNLCTN